MRTNYSTGPYVVVSMDLEGWLHRGRRYEFWRFSCDRLDRDGPRWPRATSWLNEYLAIGRRILGFMNDDEIFVEGFHEEAAKRLRPKAEQMDLFK
ncbi:MAG: hypothetical protein GC206_11870 [Alphaproteobacteria bacterium]|nr:hypothetical protein [Alphaproteobacteria bacterium]